MSLMEIVCVCVCVFLFFLSFVINAVHCMLNPTTRFSVQSKILLESCSVCVTCYQFMASVDTLSCCSVIIVDANNPVPL